MMKELYENRHEGESMEDQPVTQEELKKFLKDFQGHILIPKEQWERIKRTVIWQNSKIKEQDKAIKDCNEAITDVWTYLNRVPSEGRINGLESMVHELAAMLDRTRPRRNGERTGSRQETHHA